MSGGCPRAPVCLRSTFSCCLLQGSAPRWSEQCVGRLVFLLTSPKLAWYLAHSRPSIHVCGMDCHTGKGIRITQVQRPRRLTELSDHAVPSLFRRGRRAHRAALDSPKASQREGQARHATAPRFLSVLLLAPLQHPYVFLPSLLPFGSSA